MTALTTSPPAGIESIGDALILTRVFDAPPERVFGLWSDVDLVRAWWHPKDFSTPVFEMDFREGGAYRFCIRSSEREGWARGVYRQIDAPRRIVMTFRWEDGSGPIDRDTLITVTFEPHGDGATRLVFRQAPFASDAEKHSHGQGWSQLLDALAAALRGARS